MPRESIERMEENVFTFYSSSDDDDDDDGKFHLEKLV